MILLVKMLPTNSEGHLVDIDIDMDALRDYLLDSCGTAAFSGFPAALAEVMDIEGMSAWELFEKAEVLGIDLRRFEVE